VLQRWTKGFNVKDVEGRDIVPLFETALRKAGMAIKVTAVINDTTGTLIASNYADPTIKMGCIFGTGNVLSTFANSGCNAAYMEEVRCIPKLRHLGLPPDQQMAINCEWCVPRDLINTRGAFDNEHVVLPRTQWDVTIDNESPRPGQQAFEKMISGYYLGEIFRRVVLDLHTQGHIFEGKNLSCFLEPFSIDTSVLAEIEQDPYENLIDTADMFSNRFKLECTEPELRLIRRLAELIGIRAARLGACGIAAICKKKDIQVRPRRVALTSGMFCRRRRVRLHQVPSLRRPHATGLSRYFRRRARTQHNPEGSGRWIWVRNKSVDPPAPGGFVSGY
jgi:hexokinase